MLRQWTRDTAGKQRAQPSPRTQFRHQRLAQRVDERAQALDRGKLRRIQGAVLLGVFRVVRGGGWGAGQGGILLRSG